MKGEVVAGRKHKLWIWVGISVLAMAIVALATFEILLARAAPILRARLLQSLSARYRSRVELGSFDVSLLRGFEVSGKDLAIYPYNIQSNTPTFSVQRFAFRTGYASLFHSSLHIGHVKVEGLRINLPPKSQRKDLAPPKAGHPQPSNRFAIYPRVSSVL